MLGRVRTTRCPSCRDEVPAGRWCNRCGAALAELAAAAPRGAPRRLLVVAGLAVSVAVVGLVVGSDEPGGPVVRDPGEVVLADDAPPPPRPTPSVVPPGGPPAERVDVICSDLRTRSVPVTEVSTDVPGELVELANGTCVVMGPEGAVTP